MGSAIYPQYIMRPSNVDVWADGPANVLVLIKQSNSTQAHLFFPYINTQHGEQSGIFETDCQVEEQ